MKRKPKKVRRIILGTGYPWFFTQDGKSTPYDSMSLYSESRKTAVPLKIKDLGNFNKIRLIAEVIE